MHGFSPKERVFLEVQRVGRMAQMGEDLLPHATPLCYVFTRGVFYIGTGGKSWKVRNLKGRRDVTFVVDEYSEDWDNLRGVRVLGTAEVLGEGKEYLTAKRLLFRKYPQYKRLGWTDGADVVLKITPDKATAWGLK